MTSRTSVAAPAERRVAALAGGVGASLLVMSALHLTHVISGGRPPYNSASAGAAEAVIAFVLFAAAVRLRRDPGASRGFALGALVFAVAGFVLGLGFTVGGGTAVDIGYHLIGLPLLLLALGLEYVSGSRSAGR